MSISTLEPASASSLRNVFGSGGYQTLDAPDRGHNFPSGIFNKKIRHELILGNLCGDDKKYEAEKRFWCIWRYFDCGWDSTRIADELSAKGYPTTANAVAQMIHRLSQRCESRAERLGLVKSAVLTAERPVPIGTRTDNGYTVTIFEGRPAHEAHLDDHQFKKPHPKAYKHDRRASPYAKRGDVVCLHTNTLSPNIGPRRTYFSYPLENKEFAELLAAYDKVRFHEPIPLNIETFAVRINRPDPQEVTSLPRCAHGVFSLGTYVKQLAFPWGEPTYACSAYCTPDGSMLLNPRHPIHSPLFRNAKRNEKALALKKYRAEKRQLKELKTIWNKKLAGLGLSEELPPASRLETRKSGAGIIEEEKSSRVASDLGVPSAEVNYFFAPRGNEILVVEES